MPELPDVTVYIERLAARTIGKTLDKVRLASPFVLRTFDPPLRAVEGKRVLAMRRVGKRIVFVLESDLFLVVHLMVAGRLRWKDERGAKIPGRVGLAAFDFPTGTVIFTEASTKKRAAMHVLAGEAALAELDPGGLELFAISVEKFGEALTRENHTLKRSLTDPRLLSGIGGAYSDEIMHRARVSPVKLTQKLDAAEIERLFAACRDVLTEWTDRLRREVGEGFPDKVTAFRPEMAVHGKYGQPCPVCGSKVQRIVHAENETNYCPTCQTGGKLLADRALSKLLKSDWPRTLEEMEERRATLRDPTRT